MSLVPLVPKNFPHRFCRDLWALPNVSLWVSASAPISCWRKFDDNWDGHWCVKIVDNLVIFWMSGLFWRLFCYWPFESSTVNTFAYWGRVSDLTLRCTVPWMIPFTCVACYAFLFRRSQFFPSTMWSLGIETRLLSLVINPTTQWTT